MKYIKNYYQHLFENKDGTLEKVNLKELLKTCNINKVTDYELGQSICTSELSEVLRKMKHNKTPGMDGLTSEFLKVFWAKLKFLVTKAINRCFEKGKLSTTLRQGIITCVPKGKKERCYMKNWRPISLLCVTFKLASGALANRLKSVLDKTRLGQLGANISPDRSSLTPQVLIGNFLKHNYPLLYELQHINLLCLYLPKEDGVSPDAEYITQIIFSIFLQ